MALTNAQYEEIMRGYERRQARALRERDRRREEILEKVPALREVEDQITAAAAERARAALREEKSAFAEGKREALIEERTRLLRENGYAPEDLQPRYTCPDCRDTGYIGSEKCHCFRQIVLDVLYEQARIRRGAEKETFENFSLDCYDDVILHDTLGITARDNMAQILDICRRFAEDFPEKPGNLLLMGEVGTGKTFLAKSIARAVLDSYRSVVYLSAPELFERLSPFNRTEDRGEELLEADLLIVDDLGTELVNSMTTAELFRCVNERILRGKGTVITTNLSMNRLRDLYSERISSRLEAEYRICWLFGSDIRKKLAD